MSNILDGNDPILFNSTTPYYSWLSNFHTSPIPIMIQGEVRYFSNAESAYQYSKTVPRTTESVLPWLTLSGQQAKYKGKTVALRDNWNQDKLAVMELIITRKFAYNQELWTRLNKTGNTPLLHLSPWDEFWGVDPNFRGRNELGKILMKIRDLDYLDVPSWCLK
jgi:ribA/ribD-fused uncharacterized protein